MDVSTVVQRSITAVLVLVALALVVGELLGQPLLLGYVATGSMEPTLAVGDGFIAVPTVLAGDIGPNDVITYDAQSLDGGGTTTHRVVGERAEGYITQGDANPFTDQDAGEPLVSNAQIHAVVLQLNGEVVVLPSLGTGATIIQNGIRSVTALFGVGAAGQIGVVTTGFGVILISGTLIYGFVTADRRRQTTRSTSRSDVMSGWLVVVGLIVILMLPLMTTMMVPTETTTNRLLSMDASIETQSGQITAGETETFPFTVSNSQYIPKVVIVEPASSGIDIINSPVVVSHRESEQVQFSVTAPIETGVFARSYAQYHYLYVLPIPVIGLLHAIHPYVAMMTISVLLTTPVVGLYILLVGIRPISLRKTHR